MGAIGRRGAMGRGAGAALAAVGPSRPLACRRATHTASTMATIASTAAVSPNQSCHVMSGNLRIHLRRRAGGAGEARGRSIGWQP